MFIKIYNKYSIADLDWMSVENGKELRNFYEPTVKNSSKVFVKNSKHEVNILQVENKLYPLTIGAKYSKNTCYLFSFIAQYIDYTREEVLEGNKYTKTQKIISRLAFPMLRVLASCLGMEKVIFVNNFFLSTNLYEKDTHLSKNSVVKYLKNYYPNKVIVFKSINEYTDRSLLQKLKTLDGLPLACRQLYILDPLKSKYQKKRPFIQDIKLWETTQNLYWEKVLKFNSREIEILIGYYKDLYLKKYSKLNPDYTNEFLKTALKSKVLDFYILREDQTKKPHAIQAVKTNSQVVCTPFIGYNKDVPKKTGLYRLMNIQLTQLAVKEGKIFNMSSGASTFKKQRGGLPVFEYHIIFVSHLPKRMQWFWGKLYKLSESIIKPTMEELGI